MDFKALREKAKAFAEKSKRDTREKSQNQPKQLKNKINKNLPEISRENINNEALLSEYMDVLRKTHENIGKASLKERLEKKKEEKLNNVNYIKTQINLQKNSNSLRRKIKKMRRKRLFPQPKSYMNYRNRNGLLKRNSIKIEK